MKALRVLWLRRRLVIAALVAAILVGVAIPYNIPNMSSRQHRVGVASASGLVDSAKSQVADLGVAGGADVGSLSYRASLLASIMTSSPIVSDIARRAGVPVSTLIVNGPTTVVGTGAPAPIISNAQISPSNPRASTLTATVPTLAAGQIPVIQVTAQAPTATIAGNLANAAFTALQADVSSVATADKIPALQRLVVRPLGPASVGEASQGPGPILGLVGAVAAFLLLCGAILGVSSVSSAWRDASVAEREGHDREERTRIDESYAEVDEVANYELRAEDGFTAGSGAEVAASAIEAARALEAAPTIAAAPAIAAEKPLTAGKTLKAKKALKAVPELKPEPFDADGPFEPDELAEPNASEEPEAAREPESRRAGVTEAALALDKLLQSL
ncbi:MAG TPA: hypothetical protein VG294_03065 [Solirubrobacteraceae bacterium]|nr:hypothetical protein [Solirubrobacteraceae bacterium]